MWGLVTALAERSRGVFWISNDVNSCESKQLGVSRRTKKKEKKNVVVLIMHPLLP